MTYYIELLERRNNKVIKRTATFDKDMADRICEGMDRNVDSSLYYSRIVKAKKDSLPHIY